MKRDYEKLVSLYHDEIQSRNNTMLYSRSEFFEIGKLANRRKDIWGGEDGGGLYMSTIDTALSIGIVLGYRACLYDTKTGKKLCRV